MSGRRLRHAAAATAAMVLVFVAFFGCMKVDSAKSEGMRPAGAAVVSQLIDVCFSSDTAADLSANAGPDAPSRGCDCGGADSCATNAIQQKAEVRAAGPEADYVGSFGVHEDSGASGVPQTRPPGVRSASTTLAMHCVWRT